jgi:hypothetical protein
VVFLTEAVIYIQQKSFIMGKINLSSLKSHIENASESYQKLQAEKPVEMRVIRNSEDDSIETLLNNTQNMLRNIPSFSQTGS